MDVDTLFQELEGLIWFAGLFVVFCLACLVFGLRCRKCKRLLAMRKTGSTKGNTKLYHLSLNAMKTIDWNAKREFKCKYCGHTHWQKIHEKPRKGEHNS